MTARPAGRLLIVDDDDAVRNFVADLLLDDFETILTAADAAEGWRHLETAEPIDVAVIDIRLPDIGGVEFAALLAELRPDIAIVVISGLDRVRQGELPPQVPFVRKPFRAGDLTEAVAAARRHRDAAAA
jgi:DNA-binding NtrC family response regulator